MKQHSNYRRKGTGKQATVLQGFLTELLHKKSSSSHCLNRDSHNREINFVRSILPISKISLETARFDILKRTFPFVKGWRYQKGFKYGWY
jgi:hypothetical protein